MTWPVGVSQARQRIAPALVVTRILGNCLVHGLSFTCAMRQPTHAAIIGVHWLVINVSLFAL